MKRIISALLIIAGLTASLTGCTKSADNSSAQTSTRESRISTAPIDTEIIGKWWNGKNGYIFGEDRKVSLIMDFSSMNINFTSDGQFNKAGEIIGKDDIQYDGKNLIVNYKTIDENNMADVNIIINMERNDAENPDSFDGSYTIYGGLLMEYLAENVGISLNDVKKDDDIEFLAEVDGESLILTVENYCDYETLGNSLEMFSKYMHYVDESADAVKYNYEIDGNALTMTFYVNDSEFKEVYERVEE